jgi:hypothetical protein
MLGIGASGIKAYSPDLINILLIKDVNIMKAYLLQDIISRLNPKKIYGKKGDKVTIISESLPALIVDSGVTKFPVHKDEIQRI